MQEEARYPMEVVKRLHAQDVERRYCKWAEEALDPNHGSGDSAHVGQP